MHACMGRTHVSRRCTHRPWWSGSCRAASACPPCRRASGCRHRPVTAAPAAAAVTTVRLRQRPQQQENSGRHAAAQAVQRCAHCCAPGPVKQQRVALARLVREALTRAVAPAVAAHPQLLGRIREHRLATWWRSTRGIRVRLGGHASVMCCQQCMLLSCCCCRRRGAPAAAHPPLVWRGT